jgi:cytochrome c-type biogenesis protein CcmF
MIVHLGVVIVALGLVASQSHSHEGEFRVSVGQGGGVAGHTIVFEGVERFSDGGRDVTSIAVRVDGEELHHPAITRYPNFGQPIGTPSVATSLSDDVYITVLDVSEDGSTVLLRVIVRPLIAWLWIGGLLMGLGTLLAIVSPRRRAEETWPTERAAHETEVA